MLRERKLKTLGVFFTRGVSLKCWVEAGLFDREVTIYKRHLASGFFDRLIWFTYGTEDTECARNLIVDGRLPEGIEVAPMPTSFKIFGRAASGIYSIVMPIVAGRFLRQCDVFKTNQMEGAIAAVISSARFRKPLYVRTGYTLSRVVNAVFPHNPLRRGLAWVTELLALHFADVVSVTSRFDFHYMTDRYGHRKHIPRIVGNFVDTKVFRPAGVEKVERVVFVGRLSPEKNLHAAVRACAEVGIGLDIIGKGPEQHALEQTVASCGADVRWLGVVSNDALPAVLDRYRYFILPSLWEGLPKALLEAMATGLVCIGNDTTGINEVIKDGANGYLSPESSAEALASTLRRAIGGGQEAIAVAAREFICSEYSLDAIVAKEENIFNQLLEGRGFCRQGMPRP